MTQKLTLLSSRLPVSPALREANEHLISKATVSLAHPKSCSHIQGIATPAQQTLNNTALPTAVLSQSTVPTRLQWMCFCCLTAHAGGMLRSQPVAQGPFPSLGSARLDLAGQDFGLSPCHHLSASLSQMALRALGFTVTTRPHVLGFLRVRMFLL